MNKKILISLAAVVIIAFSAFKIADTKDHLAKVQKIDGLAVYVLSEPADGYYKLGQVGTGTISQFNSMMKTMVKNVKTQYPDAEGAMFDAEKNIGFAIKFK